MTRAGLLLLAGALALAGCATSRDRGEPRAGAPRAGAEESAPRDAAQVSQGEVEGHIMGLGGLFTRKSIRIDSNEAERPTELRVDRGTRIFLDGDEVGFGELREGDAIRAVYEIRGETPFAVEVDATR